jgi:hypothetical protein
MESKKLSWPLGSQDDRQGFLDGYRDRKGHEGAMAQVEI